MKKLFALIVLAGTAFTLSGCLNQDSSPVYYNVEGMVTENGSPVYGAKIHFKNNFDPGGFRNEVIGDSVVISFNSSTAGLYTASLFRHGADSILTTFFEDSLGTGVQNIPIPDSLLSNGVFGYEVSTELQYLGANLFLVNKPNADLVGTLPATYTGYGGSFTLEAGELALGRQFNFSGGERFEITDSLQIIVVKDSVISAIERVKIEPNEENYFEISLD